MYTWFLFFNKFRWFFFGCLSIFFLFYLSIILWQGYMRKFIQNYFFHLSIFPLLIKQWGKLKSFLFSHFSILLPFSILSFSNPSNQTYPQSEVTLKEWLIFKTVFHTETDTLKFYIKPKSSSGHYHHHQITWNSWTL